jgi:NAD(P)H-hydrate epimerase
MVQIRFEKFVSEFIVRPQKAEAITAVQMQAIDVQTQREFGISSLILMEHAGTRVAEVALGVLKTIKGKRVAIFSGKGNNGGDGFVAARHLVNHNVDVKVYLAGSKGNLSEDSLANLQILSRMGVDVKEITDLTTFKMTKEKLRGSSLIIDGLIGTGLTRQTRGLLHDLIEFLNAQDIRTLSIDVPSGLNATTGFVEGVAVKADYTVTLGLPKKGLFINQGPDFCGQIILTDIGIPRKLFPHR